MSLLEPPRGVWPDGGMGMEVQGNGGGAFFQIPSYFLRQIVLAHILHNIYPHSADANKVVWDLGILKYLDQWNKTKKIDYHKATYYVTLHQG